MNHDRTITLWINQSNLLWSRLQTASAIEAGSLAAAYNILPSHKCWSVALLIAASLLLFGVLLLMMRDVQYLDAIRKYTAADVVIPKPAKRMWSWDAWKTDDTGSFDPREFGGRHVGFFSIVLLILINVAAIWCF